MPLAEQKRPLGPASVLMADAASEGDEDAVRTLTRLLSDAWNANDAHRYAAMFTEDCDYIAFDGTHLKGREENARHHETLLHTVLRGSRLQYTTVQVRFLAPDVALMHADGSVLMSWQHRLPTKRHSIQTYVVVNHGGEWRIAAFQNSRLRPLRLPRGLPLKLLLTLFRLRTVLAGRPYASSGGQSDG